MDNTKDTPTLLSFCTGYGGLDMKNRNQIACARYYAKNREKILAQKRNKPPGYNSWKGMKQRCNNPNRDDYKYYGGAGIKYFDGWETFSGFIKDMGNPPTRKHTLDRINGNKGYFPENCRWATRLEQCQNLSSCRMVEHDGETKTLSQIARDTNTPLSTLHKQLKRVGGDS